MYIYICEISQGDFEDNKIQRKGTLEWQDNCWYEGDFRDGYRDGKGTMVNRDYNLLYIGQWHRGLAHGKGFVISIKNLYLLNPLFPNSQASDFKG